MIGLDDLRREWKNAVCLIPPVEQRGEHFPRVKPCWFGENVPGIDPCEHGPRGIEGAHWIKRQEVARVVGFNLWIPTAKKGRSTVFVAGSDNPELLERLELLYLAEWDPRNGVPACEKHHRRFDGARVDARNPLIVWRHEVPAHVEGFALDWGLETALEDRNPPIGKGI